MGKLGLGPVGMTVQVSADGRHLDEAAALEGLGYSAIWLRGGQIDNLSRITEVVRATSWPAACSPDHARGPVRVTQTNSSAAPEFHSRAGGYAHSGRNERLRNVTASVTAARVPAHRLPIRASVRVVR
jgi:hypothetical protein